MSKDVHYAITSEVIDSHVEHIYAPNQETAIDRYINGGNQYGYTAEFFDGYEIYIVPMSKVSVFMVEENPEPQYLVKKVT